MENPVNRIVSLAIEGNQHACEELIDMLYPVLEPIARKNLTLGDEKQDLLQEIFMKIFSKIHQYAGRKPLGHWAAKIAVNTCYDRLRKKKIRPELIYGERAVQTAIKPKLSYSRRIRSTENELIKELIQELLSTLNEQERTVIQLMELKEKTVKEVCELTGWSESKVKVTKMRARKKLQSAMIHLEKNPLKPLSSVGIAY
jgi:RNA polymerase sigma-70 factor (ECF subfamily)